MVNGAVIQLTHVSLQGFKQLLLKRASACVIIALIMDCALDAFSLFLLVNALTLAQFYFYATVFLTFNKSSLTLKYYCLNLYLKHICMSSTLNITLLKLFLMFTSIKRLNYNGNLLSYVTLNIINGFQ